MAGVYLQNGIEKALHVQQVGVDERAALGSAGCIYAWGNGRGRKFKMWPSLKGALDIEVLRRYIHSAVRGTAEGTTEREKIKEKERRFCSSVSFLI